MRMMRIAGAALLASVTLGAAVAQQGITRTPLQRHDLSAAGWEVIQVRVGFGPGASFPRHRHPGEEVINVTQGTLRYEVDGKPPVTLRAGEVLFIPAGTVHAARNAGRGEATELATYIVRKGRPLGQLVK